MCPCHMSGEGHRVAVNVVKLDGLTVGQLAVSQCRVPCSGTGSLVEKCFGAIGQPLDWHSAGTLAGSLTWTPRVPHEHPGI